MAPTRSCVAAFGPPFAERAMRWWVKVRAHALEHANPKRTTTYPFTISFVSAETGDHMGDIEFEYEAESRAVVRELLDDMESGNIKGFPELLCQWHRYRLLYDGKQLNDDGILDYIVAADNPTVNVIVTQEPPQDECDCTRCRKRDMPSAPVDPGRLGGCLLYTSPSPRDRG